MVKINYQVENLIGDILSKDGHYVDILSCSEYTLWYLIRQEGIHSFLPALGTKAFFSSASMEQDTGFDAFADFNMRTILYNCKRYFHIKTVCFEAGEDIHSFIKRAVDQGHFVYTVYDSFYDSLQDKKLVHDYHGHPITGYDDLRGIYISFFEGEHEVKYEDMEKMITQCKKREGTYFLKFFFLCRESEKEEVISDKVIRRDCLAVLSDWKQEINCFKDYIELIKRMPGRHIKEQKKFAYRQRLIFNSAAEGLHYNFVFRLRLMEQYLDFHEGNLAEEFIANRKKAILIANMYRKLFILLDKNESSAAGYIRKLTRKIEEVFVAENQKLMQSYEKILRKEVFH